MLLASSNIFPNHNNIIGIKKKIIFGNNNERYWHSLVLFLAKTNRSTKKNTFFSGNNNIAIEKQLFVATMNIISIK